MKYGAYEYYNANPLKKDLADCTLRAISVATGKSWDYVYDYLSDLAQDHGTLIDDSKFIRWFLDSNFQRVPTYGMTVGKVSKEYDDNIVLITMKGHITVSKYGKIYDTFDCSDRLSEFCWVVE